MILILILLKYVNILFSLFKIKTKRAKARPKIYYLSNSRSQNFSKILFLFFQDGSDKNNFEPILDQYGNLLRGGDLMVHNVQAEDAGIYFCLAKTNSGHTVATFHLRWRPFAFVLAFWGTGTRQLGVNFFLLSTHLYRQ